MNKTIYKSKREYILDGIKGCFDTYPFTHEQAFDILHVLEKNYDLDRVATFIWKIRFCCEGAACLLDQPDYRTYKNDRKSMLRTLEKSKELLDAITDSRGLYRISNYAALLGQEHVRPADECSKLAKATHALLEVLIDKIREFDNLNEQTMKGHPIADSNGIVREIAKAWESSLGVRPTQYAGGPFEDVVKVVLKGLNMTHEYPQRKIKAALKE